MNNLKLKTHYSYFIPILVIQVIVALGYSIVLPIDEYALLTLYLTTINIFTFTSLGANIGFSLNHRNKQMDDVVMTRSVLTEYVVVQILIEVLVIAVQISLDVKSIYIVIGFSIFAMSLYDYVRYYYLTFNSAHKVNILNLSLKLLILIEIPLYILTNSFLAILTFDMFVRLLVPIVALIDIYISTPNIDKLKNKKLYLVADIKTGFPVMVSSLLFSSSLMFDKYALSSDLDKLAVYAFAINIVLIIRLLIKPLNDVLFVNIQKNFSSDYYKQISQKILFISFPLILFISIFTSIVLSNIPVFAKYNGAFQLIPILVLIIPLMIPLESILINLNKLHNFKFLFLKVVFAAAVSIICLFGYTVIADSINLLTFASIVIFIYIIYYLVFSYKVITGRVIFQNMITYLTLSVIYLTIIYIAVYK